MRAIVFLRHDQRCGENDSFIVEFVHKSRMLTVAVFGSAAFASWDWCCRLISTSVNGTGWISVGWVTHFSALQVYASVMRCTPHRTRPLSRFPHMSAINVTSQRASRTSLKIMCCISFTGYCSIYCYHPSPDEGALLGVVGWVWSEGTMSEVGSLISPMLLCLLCHHCHLHCVAFTLHLDWGTSNYISCHYNSEGNVVY